MKKDEYEEQKSINRKEILFFLYIVFFAVIFFDDSLPVYAEAMQNKTIKVAYPIQKGLTDLDEYGNYTGYMYEYLQEVAQYTGWKYEFVQVPGDTDESLTILMDMVKNGEVDLMGGMLYNESLDSSFDYTSHSYGAAETVLQVLYKETRDTIINSQIEQNLKVAVVKDSRRIRAELEEYCEMNLITPEYVECKDEEEQKQKLENREADVMLNSSVTYIEGVKTIAKFASKPYYFVTAKGKNKDILEELNSVISTIEETDPYFTTSLYEKYFLPKEKEFFLTDLEDAYIQNVDTLKVGVYTNQPPFQYKDKETGELKGIAVDLLKYVSGKTEIQFEMVEVNDDEQVSELVEQGDIQMIAGMTYNYDLANQQNMAMSRPYVSSQYTLLINESVSEESIKGKKLALTNKSVYHGSYLGDVHLYENLEACIRAVIEGEADYTYTDAYSAQYYLNLPEFHKLRQIPQTYDPREICFGIVNQGHKELLTILNKTIVTIPIETLQAMVFQNTTYKPQFSFKYFLEQYVVESIVMIATVLLLIILVLCLILRNRAKMNRKTSLELKKHFQVYQLLKDYFFEYDYHADTLMISCPEDEESQMENDSILQIDYSKMNEEDKKDKKREAFLKLIRSKEDGIHEMCLPDKDGSEHWVRVALRTIYDEDKEAAYSIGKITNIDKEKEEKEHLLKQAQRDGLTKLYNMETVHKKIEEELSILQDGDCAALIMVDIDYFKTINDTYGHPRGDEVLKEVAKKLLSNFRSEDIVGRIGGDEFIVYMRQVHNPEVTTDKCKRLCAQMRKIELEEGHNLTVSVGAAIAIKGDRYEEIYERADQALYQTKKQGRNGYWIGLQ